MPRTWAWERQPGSHGPVVWDVHCGQCTGGSPFRGVPLVPLSGTLPISGEHMVVAGKGGGGSQDSPVPESRRTQEPLSQSGPWFPELSNRQVAFGDAHGPCQPKHASTHRHAWNRAMGLSLHTPPPDGGPPAETLRQHRHSSDSAWPGSALLDPPLQHYPVGTWRRRGPLGPRLGSSAQAFLVHEQGRRLLTWGPRPAWLPGPDAPPRLCLGPRVV